MSKFQDMTGSVLVMSPSNECRVNYDNVLGLPHICIGSAEAKSTISYLVTIRPPDYGNELNQRLFTCKECNYNTTDGSNYRNHIRAVHRKVRPYSCELCTFSSSNPRLLKRHFMARHTHTKPFSCQFCKFRCSVEGYLKRHLIKMHPDYRPFNCSLCQYNACTIRDLKKHRSTEHAMLELKSCSKCSYCCNSLTMLRRHFKENHISESDTLKAAALNKHFKCTYCNISMKHKYNLNRHIRLKHSREGLIKCSQCSYSTTHNYFLNHHVMHVHQRLRPFACQICDFRTSRRHILNQHTRIVHLRLKPYKCDTCNFRAPMYSHLKRHIAACHLDYKPNACSLCPYRTFQKCNLKLHMAKVHMTPCTEFKGRGGFNQQDEKLNKLVKQLEAGLKSNRTDATETDGKYLEIRPSDMKSNEDPPEQSINDNCLDKSQDTADRHRVLNRIDETNVAHPDIIDTSNVECCNGIQMSDIDHDVICSNDRNNSNETDQDMLPIGNDDDFNVINLENSIDNYGNIQIVDNV